jgi:hypothetical protein
MSVSRNRHIPVVLEDKLKSDIALCNAGCWQDAVADWQDKQMDRAS